MFSTTILPPNLRQKPLKRIPPLNLPLGLQPTFKPFAIVHLSLPHTALIDCLPPLSPLSYHPST